jgi:hypothetical protein
MTEEKQTWLRNLKLKLYVFLVGYITTVSIAGMYIF